MALCLMPPPIGVGASVTAEFKLADHQVSSAFSNVAVYVGNKDVIVLEKISELIGRFSEGDLQGIGNAATRVPQAPTTGRGHESRRCGG